MTESFCRFRMLYVARLCRTAKQNCQGWSDGSGVSYAICRVRYRLFTPRAETACPIRAYRVISAQCGTSARCKWGECHADKAAGATECEPHEASTLAKKS